LLKKGGFWPDDGGFWPEDFSKNLYLVTSPAWWRRSAAPERLMTDLVEFMFSGTGSIDRYI